MIAKHGPHEYVRILRSYRNAEGKPRNTIVENHGRKDALLAQNPNAIEELRAHVEELNRLEAQQKLKHRQEEAGQYMKTLQTLAGDPNGSVQSVWSLNIGVACLKRVWEALHLDVAFRTLQARSQVAYSLNQAAFAVVAGEILQTDHAFVMELETPSTPQEREALFAILQAHADDLLRQLGKGMEAVCGERLDEEDLASLDLCSVVALSMRRALAHLLKAKGLSIPDARIVTTLRAAEVLPVELDPSRRLFLKLNADAPFDAICGALGLGVVGRWEDSASLQHKLHFRGIRREASEKEHASRGGDENDAQDSGTDAAAQQIGG